MISRGIFEQIIFFVQSSRRKEKYGRDFGRFIYIYIYIRDEYERNEEEINWVIRDWWIARLYPRWKTFMRQVVPMCGGERKVRTKSVRTCNRIWNRKTTCITVKDLLAPLLYSKLSQTVRSKATLVARIRWAVQECIDLPWHTIWARDQVSTPLPAFYTVRSTSRPSYVDHPLSLSLSTLRLYFTDWSRKESSRRWTIRYQANNFPFFVTSQGEASLFCIPVQEIRCRILGNLIDKILEIWRRKVIRFSVYK